MKKYILLLLLSLSSLSFGQSLSNFKYVIVPDTFSFQKSANEYDLNKLTQFLLNKYNFESFIEGDTEGGIPKVEASKLLRLKVIEKGTFNSKINLVFLDYKGTKIYTSKEGKSSRKDFKGSYTEALRDAFEDTVIKNHVFKEVSDNTKITTPTHTPKKEAPVKASQHSKTEAVHLKFELRGKEYVFIPLSQSAYTITNGKETLGNATLQKDGVTYKLEAATLSGEGTFDDYGNFILTRINPANNKKLTDTMSRLE